MTHRDWISLAQHYRQQELWGEAINAYKRALELQPDGPAKVELELVYDILAYRNTELFNP